MTDQRPLNCWEMLNCGNGPDNPDSACPVPFAAKHDGINSGINAGRYCWMFMDTLCYDESQRTIKAKTEQCMACPFFRQVQHEQGCAFVFRHVNGR